MCVVRMGVCGATPVSGRRNRATPPSATLSAAHRCRAVATFLCKSLSPNNNRVVVASGLSKWANFLSRVELVYITLGNTGAAWRMSTSPKTKLDKWEQLAKIASLFALPVVVAILGYIVQKQLASDNLSRDYVQLAVGVLKEKKQPGDEELRRWAVNLLNSNSPNVKLNPIVMEQLQNGDVRIPNYYAPVVSNYDYTAPTVSNYNLTKPKPVPGQPNTVGESASGGKPETPTPK